MDMTKRSEELYQAAKWALSGAELSARSLKSMSQQADMVMIDLIDCRNRAEDTAPYGSLAEVLGALIVESDRLMTTATAAMEQAGRVVSVCQSVLRQVMKNPADSLSFDIDSLFEMVKQLQVLSEEVENQRPVVVDGLLDVTDHAHNDSGLLDRLEKSVSIARNMQTLVAYASDAVATVTLGTTQVAESSKRA